MEFDNFVELFLEKDNRPKINKFLQAKYKKIYPDDPETAENVANLIADTAHEISDKHSINLANIINNSISDGMLTSDDPVNTIKVWMINSDMVVKLTEFTDLILKNQNVPKFNTPIRDLSTRDAITAVSNYNHIFNWIQDSGEFNKDLDWNTALDLADDWLERTATTDGIEIKEHEEILKGVFDGQDFIKIDGEQYYWLSLGVRRCQDEGKGMGHCAAAEKGLLYSLRNRSGQPKITADIDEGDEVAGQIYGRFNKKPDEKYHKAILYLLGYFDISAVQVKHYSEESFNPEDDLSSEDLDWYEEKFSTELSRAGITEEMLDDAQERIDKFNEKSKGVSVSMNDHGDGYGFDVSMSFDVPLDINEEYKGNFGGEWYNGTFNVYTLNDDGNRWADQNDDSSFEYVLDGVLSDADHYDSSYESDYKEFVKGAFDEGMVLDDDIYKELIMKLIVDYEFEDDYVVIDDNKYEIPYGLYFEFNGEIRKDTSEFTHWEDGHSIICNAYFQCPLPDVSNYFDKKVGPYKKGKLLKSAINALNKKQIVKRYVDREKRSADEKYQLKFDFMDESATASNLLNQDWHLVPTTSLKKDRVYLSSFASAPQVTVTKYFELFPEDTKGLYEEFVTVSELRNEIKSLIESEVERYFKSRLKSVTKRGNVS